MSSLFCVVLQIKRRLCPGCSLDILYSLDVSGLLILSAFHALSVAWFTIGFTIVLVYFCVSVGMCKCLCSCMSLPPTLETVSLSVALCIPTVDQCLTEV